MSDGPLRRTRPELAGLDPYRPPREPPPVKLDANESPWPLPDDARAAIAEAVAGLAWHRYPDARSTEVRARLAASLGAAPEELVVGAGSDDVIAFLLSAFRRAPFGRATAAVVFPAPTFVMYDLSSRMAGLRPVPVPLRPDDWSLDPERLIDVARAADAGLVFLASPNNPTGNRFSDAALRRIADALPDALVVIDEAYRPFAAGHADALFDPDGNVAMLGTLSKAGLAAARFGWGRLPRRLAAVVDRVRQPYAVPAPTQAVAALALGPLAPTLDALVGRIVGERARLEAALDASPTIRRRYPSEANFVLVEVDDAAAVDARLRDRGVWVRRFPREPALAARHLRITVGTPAETDALIAALDA